MPNMAKDTNVMNNLPTVTHKQVLNSRKARKNNDLSNALNASFTQRDKRFLQSKDVNKDLSYEDSFYAENVNNASFYDDDARGLSEHFSIDEIGSIYHMSDISLAYGIDANIDTNDSALSSEEIEALKEHNPTMDKMTMYDATNKELGKKTRQQKQIDALKKNKAILLTDESRQAKNDALRDIESEKFGSVKIAHIPNDRDDKTKDSIKPFPVFDDLKNDSGEIIGQVETHKEINTPFVAIPEKFTHVEIINGIEILENSQPYNGKNYHNPTYDNTPTYNAIGTFNDNDDYDSYLEKFYNPAVEIAYTPKKLIVFNEIECKYHIFKNDAINGLHIVEKTRNGIEYYTVNSYAIDDIEEIDENVHILSKANSFRKQSKALKIDAKYTKIDAKIANIQLSDSIINDIINETITSDVIDSLDNSVKVARLARIINAKIWQEKLQVYNLNKLVTVVDTKIVSDNFQVKNVKEIGLALDTEKTFNAMTNFVLMSYDDDINPIEINYTKTRNSTNRNGEKYSTVRKVSDMRFKSPKTLVNAINSGSMQGNVNIDDIKALKAKHDKQFAKDKIVTVSTMPITINGENFYVAYSKA